MIYTESKWENMIRRLTSTADNPRQTERVPRGAEFSFQMVYNLMELKDVDRLDSLFMGLNLLEDDYLGGSGSRGYGRIEFRQVQIGLKTTANYEGDNQLHVLFAGMLKDLSGEERELFKSKLKDMLKAGAEKDENL